MIQDAKGGLGRNGRGPRSNKVGASQSSCRECELPFALDTKEAVALHPKMLAKALAKEAAR